MNANELLGVHSLAEIGDSLTQHVATTVGMQATIVVGDLHPIDFFNGKKYLLLTLLH